MGIYKRVDGVYIKDLPDYQKFFPFIMRKRTQSAIYFSQKINLTKTMKYCIENNVKIFHVFIAALVRTGAQRPALNRFIVGKRVYQRNGLILGFMAKKEINEESREISVKIKFEKDDNLADVQKKINENVGVIKRGGETDVDGDIRLLIRLPVFITSFIMWFIRALDHYGLLSSSFIENNPLYVSTYVTNVGSIGVDAPFHHLYEWGTTSVFAALGKIHKDFLINEDGKPVVTDIVNVNFTIDERIADGVYMARTLQMFKHYMENPDELE